MLINNKTNLILQIICLVSALIFLCSINCNAFFSPPFTYPAYQSMYHQPPVPMNNWYNRPPLFNPQPPFQLPPFFNQTSFYPFSGFNMNNFSAPISFNPFYSPGAYRPYSYSSVGGTDFMNLLTRPDPQWFFGKEIARTGMSPQPVSIPAVGIETNEFRIMPPALE